MAFLQYANQLKQYVPSLSPQQAEDYINLAWRDIRESNDEWTFLHHTEYWLAPAAILLQGLGVVQFSSSVALTYTNLAQLVNQTNPALTLRQLRFGPSGGPIYGIAGTDIGSGTGAVTNGGFNLVSAEAIFDVSMTGLLVTVEGAGAGGGDLETTLTNFLDPFTFEMGLPSQAALASTPFVFGSTLTLDRVFNEGTNANASAQCYRIYYSPLSTNFDRLDYLTDPVMGYEFDPMVRDRSELDMMDPQRTSQGQPWALFYHGYDDTTELPIYEMWPAPTAARAYTVAYWSKGEDFVEDTDALPPRISPELLLMRGRMLAYEWGMTADPNPGRAAGYMQALNYARSRYSTEGLPGARLGLLDQAKRRDRSIALTMYKRYPRAQGPGFPWADSNFNQRHAIPSGIGGWF